MASIEETPTGSPEIDPQWVAGLRALQAEEAIQWKGHEFDEDGWHDEDECRVYLESKAVVNDCLPMMLHQNASRLVQRVLAALSPAGREHGGRHRGDAEGDGHEGSLTGLTMSAPTSSSVNSRNVAATP